ncbi:MAG: hypothetical protein KBT39_00445 [Bacteroidales bacterium]|nr:hypothetical protein [Bacteroidales bacterium]
MGNKVSIIFLLFYFMCITNANAQAIDVTLQVGYIDPSINKNGSHRTPPAALHMEVDGNVLYLPSLQNDYDVRLEDLDGIVVWEQHIYNGEETVTIPLQLTGCYKLVLTREFITYYAFISL